MTRVLDAWLYGTRVARVEAETSDRVSMTYTDQALQRWGENASVVSGLLPLSARPPHPARVQAWLRGLLPEGRARLHLALRAGVDPDDVVGFLATYGRDTAGALVLVPSGEDPIGTGDLVEIDDERIGELLDAARVQGAADQVTSLGGLETKIVLVRTGRGWSEPTGSTPSTHLVKLARPQNSPTADLIDTEAAALALARAVGLTTIDAEIHDFAGRRAIVVSRYDRRSVQGETGTAGAVERIHQEDGAQLLGLETTDPERKFQWGRSLPSLRALALKLIAMGEPRPRGLLALTTFNLALGNPDAHAKNLSVVHLTDGSTHLAPAYDIAMNLHHDHVAPTFAMDVRGKRDMLGLTSEDLIAEGRSWGLSAGDAATAVSQTLTGVDGALAAIAHDQYPGVSDEAWLTVRRRTQTLLRQVPQTPRGGRRGARSGASATNSRSSTDAPRAQKGTPSGGRFVAHRTDGEPDDPGRNS